MPSNADISVSTCVPFSGYPQLTLVVPCYNEADNIPAFFNAATACFDNAGVTCEYVFVNDGSADETPQVFRSLVESERWAHLVRTVSFSRNFGKEAALYAGLQASTGQYVAFIDADMQQLPEDALRMYTILQEQPEYDIVAACQVNRKEGAVLKAFKRAFYSTFNHVSDDVDIPANVSDFRVFRRTVATALLQLPERERFSKGLFAWVGFNTYQMPYEPQARENGSSKWSFSRLFKYAVNGIFSFTTWPLKVAVWIGCLAALFGGVYLLIIVLEYLFKGISVPGYPTLACLIILFGGLQLLVLGVIGEYLARNYIEDKQRPVYIAKETLCSYSDGVEIDNDVSAAGMGGLSCDTSAKDGTTYTMYSGGAK